MRIEKILKVNSVWLELECPPPLQLIAAKICRTDKILSVKTRTQFHLAALDTIFVKTQKPIYCRQKEFVYSLQILQ